MAWTEPLTWATNDTVTASVLNTHLRDNLGYLHSPPRCRVYNSATISHATSGSTQIVTFNSERYDTDSMHSTSSDSGRITFTTAGVYLVGANVEFAANATGSRILQLYLNGASILDEVQVAGSASFSQKMKLVTTYSFAAGDYVTVVAFQDSGGALNMNRTANHSLEFWAQWVAG